MVEVEPETVVQWVAAALDKARLEGYHADDLDTDRGLPCACRIEEDTQDNWTEIRVCGKHQQERARTRALVKAAASLLLSVEQRWVYSYTEKCKALRTALRAVGEEVDSEEG
jgi:hypothetical protein